jgi:chorismate synthase
MVFDYITSGESHGKMLTAVINNVPAGFKVDIDGINTDLKRRQAGYGRGGRMKIETDTVEIVAGVRNGETTGSPVCLIIKNKDYKNWENKDVEDFTRPRPGHADLTGGRKYRRSDLRDILERASARETAIRVGAGSFAKSILTEFGIRIKGFVTSIGGIEAFDTDDLSFDDICTLSEKSKVRTADNSKDGQMIDLIDKAKSEGDTLGGTIRVLCHNVPPMLGSFSHYGAKLDARLAASLMSIQAIKGVSFGLGFTYAKKSGKNAHDEIFYSDEKGFYHKTNNAGGIEGGMSNGNDIVIDCVMKPIPTLMTPLKSVDIKTKEAFDAVKERSDVCAVPACAVVAECVAAVDILRAMGDAFGADNIYAMKKALDEALKYNF